jgi:hypothetical protein
MDKAMLVWTWKGQLPNWKLIGDFIWMNWINGGLKSYKIHIFILVDWSFHILMGIFVLKKYGLIYRCT